MTRQIFYTGNTKCAGVLGVIMKGVQLYPPGTMFCTSQVVDYYICAFRHFHLSVQVNIRLICKIDYRTSFQLLISSPFTVSF